MLREIYINVDKKKGMEITGKCSERLKIFKKEQQFLEYFSPLRDYVPK